MIGDRRWLGLWARLGVRNEFQRGRSPAEVAELNARFLANNTRYLRHAEITAAARRHFDGVDFVEQEWIATSEGRSAALAPFVRRLPPLARAYSGLRERALLLR